MTFALKHGGPHLFRQRADLAWINLRRRAADLGWNGRSSLRFHDSDGRLLGGFVPQEARP